MKIEPGYYRCRNGSKARVLCTDAPGSLPIAGYVIESDEEFTANPFVWRPDGAVFLTNQSDYDLIEPWREKSKYEVSEKELQKLEEWIDLVRGTKEES